MKKTYPILLIAAVVTILVACKKDKGDNDPNKDLKNTWELAEVQAGMTPLKTYEPGNGNLLTFDADNYAYYKGGQVIEQGKYGTAPDNSVEENVCLINLKDSYKTRIDFASDGPRPMVYQKTFYYVADDNLYLISGCFAVDAGSKLVYRRVKPMPID